MTDNEILNFYKFAKDPIAEIIILSHLTLMPVKKIVSIIRKYGYIIDDTKIPKQPSYYCIRWTDDEEKQLLELKHKGLTFKEIGDAMSRTKNSVYNRYQKLKKVNSLKVVQG